MLSSLISSSKKKTIIHISEEDQKASFHALRLHKTHLEVISDV